MTKHVVVVGGGVIGLCTAYYLRRGGAAVTVLERGAVGSGASWGNTGWITPTFSAPLPGPGMMAIAMQALARPNGSFYLSVRHVPQLAPWLWRFWRASSATKHEAGMRATARFALRTNRLYDELAADGVQFEMRQTGMIHAFTRAANAEMAHRALLPLRDLGYDLPEAVIDGRRLRDLEPALGEVVAVGFVVPGERVVYPPSLLSGLKARLVEMGAAVREYYPISGFATNGSVISAVQSADETIEVDELVLAAGVWTRRLAAQLGVKVPLAAGKGYSFTVSPVRLPSHCLHLFEAKVAVSPFGTGMRVAGTMELSGTSAKLNRRRVAAVARASQPYLSGWNAESLRDEWMGMRPMTPDGLPIIGRAQAWRNLSIASGHGMIGVTLAPPTGQALATVILEDRDPEELCPFSPGRFGR